MGITADTLRFALFARASGADFSHTVQFGRQQPLQLTGSKIEKIFARFGYSLENGEGRRLLKDGGGYSEPLFHALGAHQVDAIDASTYEDATLVHDMNQPLPSTLKRRFSLVFDSGSLEHVFSAETALRNCMEMVAPGGHLLIATPANNWFGHGFYQFSPEFFYRALSAENGFVLEHMLAHTWQRPDRWYAVADPAAVGHRVSFVNTAPLTLFTSARRIGEADPFLNPPMQSDYAHVWDEFERRKRRIDPVMTASAQVAQRLVPRQLRITVSRHHAKRYRLYHRDGMPRVKPEQLARTFTTRGEISLDRSASANGRH